MRTHQDAKTMAKSLRASLAQRQIELSHSESLELVAQQFGYRDWNTLAALIPDPDARPNDPRLEGVTPIVRIFSVEKAKEFYLDFLGFTLDREHRWGDDFPLYAEISHSGVTLHLSEHHGDASPGVRVIVWMTGIEALHRELTAKRYRYSKPSLEHDGWGQWIDIGDPFGNAIVFRERSTGDDVP